MKNVKYLSFILFSFVIFSSCKKEKYAVFDTPQTFLNYSYGEDPSQKVDIFLPAGRSQGTTRVILLIHGGGWMAGSSKDMETFFVSMKEKMPDYAIVNMNYRLAELVGPKFMLPMQTDDIHSAINYMKSHAEAFGIKPEFVVVGLSAGGHLAMLYSYKHDLDRSVKAVVNIVGPSNLNDTFYLNNWAYNIAMNRITDPANLPAGMSQSVFGSPITWITSKAPPTISFYGTNDEFIPLSQHSFLEENLDKVNVYNEKHIYEGGHSVGYDNKDDIVNKTKSFLERRIK